MTARLEDLRIRLRAHAPHDAQEAEHLSRMLALVEARGSAREQNPNSAPDPFARAHYAPGHFTASAFVLSPDDSALLLILHGKLHRWLQPGGHVDPGDADILAAARRELKEEVGLEDLALAQPGIFDVDVHDIPAGRDPAHAHFDVRFVFRAQDLHVRAASDAMAARWVPLREIDAQLSDRSVMRAVEKLLAP